jgi:GntR family transcriptional regulator
MIKKGVREALLKRERAKFLKEEWPALRERMQRLGIDVKTLAEEE